MRIKQLPDTENPIVLRTDFWDPKKWDKICEAITQPNGLWQAHVEFIDDPHYYKLTIKQVLEATEKKYQHNLIILADHHTMTTPDFLLLVVDLWDEPGRAFYTPPDQIPAIENNLSIRNMDFHQFADNVEEDGVFRGFGNFSDLL